jgi:eukaryotic-like serine/threonine-protein kinase
MTQTSLSEEAIFLAALDKPTHSERVAYVEEACAGNDALRKRIHELLASHDASRGPLDVPLVALEATSDALAERPGTQIGPYKLIEQIGEGGMGTVWMAQQSEPVKRLVAVKLIKAGMDSRQVIARFEAERQALALMDHTNIAKVLDAGTTLAGRPYFVMDLVRGVPITRYCDEHHLTPRQRLDLFIPVCQAIQHAHQKGIIHRDLKPNNVLVALYDGKPVPKVIDFGVAKATGQSLTDKTLVTGFGSIVGTLEYMSPEQAESNQLDIDTRSDIYSLGVLLYELLTGSTPFSRKELEKTGMLEMLRVIREEEPSKPSTKLSTAEGLPTLAANRGTEPAKLARLVRGELDWIVMKALEKDRSRRYETANEFAADVQRYLADESVQACPPSAGYRLRKFARRNRGRLAAAAVLGVALFVACGAVAGSVGWAWRDRAAQQATVAGRVDQLLGESVQLYEQRKLPEATQIARSALALAKVPASNPETARRVGEWLNDLDMVARLEEIHPRGDGDWKLKLLEYPQAFREYGIDIESLAPEEAAARIASRPIRVDLAVALDRWVIYAFNWGDHMGLAGEKGVALRARLHQIARLADSNEVRNRVRDGYADGGNQQQKVEDMRTLAASIDLDSTPVATLSLIGDALETPETTSFYTRVQQRYPSDFGVTFHLGRILLYQDDLDNSIRFLTAAVAIRPQSHYARLTLARALRNKGQVDEAIAAFGAADRLSGSPMNRLEIGGLLLRQAGREQEAAVEFREVLRQSSKPAEVHQSMGFLYAAADKYDEAIASYQEATRLQPDLASAHNGLGAALGKKGLMDDAILAHREAVRLQPNVAEYHQQLGLALRSKGVWDEAIAEQSVAIRLSPHYAPYRNEFGLTLTRAGRGDAAIAAFREAAKLMPEDPVLHTNLGSELGKENEFDAAIVAFREALRLQPDYAQAHLQLGIALERKGLLDDSLVALREAIRLAPTNPAARFSFGYSLLKKGLLIDAIAAHAEAVRLAPDDARYHVEFGTALYLKGLTDDAIAEYRKAIRLNPGIAHAYHSLGIALEKKGLVDDAIDAHREAVLLEPTNAKFRRRLGNALKAKGLVDDAILEFGEAIRLQPDLAVGQYGLGGVLASHGQWEPAAAAYSRGLELDKDPNNQYAWYIGLPLQLAADDKEGYRRLCQQMLEKFGATQDLIAAEWTAKTCALIPDAVDDFELIEKLADRIVSGTENHSSYRFFVLVKVLVEYRAGRHAEAVRWAERYAPTKDGNEFDAFVLATLSMAEHRLGNADKARAALASAKAIVTNKRPDPANGRPFVNWHEWLHTDTVLREAEMLARQQ